MAKIKVKTNEKKTVRLDLTEREARAVLELLSHSNGDVSEQGAVYKALLSANLKEFDFEYRLSHGCPGLWKTGS